MFASSFEDISDPSERPAGPTQPRKKRWIDQNGAISSDAFFIRNEVAEPCGIGKSSYIIGRNYAATTRLNSQHLLWKLELGWCLHPSLQALMSTAQPVLTTMPEVLAPMLTSSAQNSIPLAAHPDTFRVADLATGTAI
ncbi:MAG: hypothetical protein Q9166_004624 [cf. Caloplaca sp. 2 TL-2023]